MISFTNKKLTDIKTLGEKLKEHRKRKGLSPEKAARAININARYIKQLEEDNYNNLPADVYSINILKRYAELLSLNPITVINAYKKEKSVYYKTKKLDKLPLRQSSKFLRTILNPKLIKYTVVLIIISFVLAYIGWSVNKIISPPDLFLYQPENNLTTTENNILITGKTEPEVTLLINEHPILSEKDGSFEKLIYLQKGKNTLKITAQKKYSKKNIIYREIIVIE